MSLLNDLRKMSLEQRKELLSSIEREEELEQEELKKNPNLHLERQMNQVIAELKNLRQELQPKYCPCPYATTTTTKVNSFDNITLESENTIDDYESFSVFSFDFIPMWIFVILLFISLLTPSKPSHTLPHLFST